jgi:hypothetical protein
VRDSAKKPGYTSVNNSKSTCRGVQGISCKGLKHSNIILLHSYIPGGKEDDEINHEEKTMVLNLK